MQHLPDLRDITVIICRANDMDVTEQKPPPEFAPILPGTVRAELKKLILLWAQERFDRFHSMFPTQTLPRVQVETLYADNDNQSSIWDGELLDRVKHVMEHWCPAALAGLAKLNQENGDVRPRIIMHEIT